MNAGYRDPRAMADLGATWDRIIVSWAAVQPNGPNDFSNMAQALPNAQINAESSSGTRVVGLLQFTPQWAAANPEFAQRSAPKNLNLPFDDPNNYWGRFVSQVATTYAGRIDDWIVWNEPEFKPGDAGAGGSYTWLGSDEEFAQLLKVAYLAIKKANPSATVSISRRLVLGRPERSPPPVLRTATRNSRPRSGRAGCALVSRCGVAQPVPKRG